MDESAKIKRYPPGFCRNESKYPPMLRPRIKVASNKEKAYVDEPRTSASKRIHATSYIIETAPETPAAASRMAINGRERGSEDGLGTRAGPAGAATTPTPPAAPAAAGGGGATRGGEGGSGGGGGGGAPRAAPRPAFAG